MKTVLISGASSGLGLFLTELLLKNGYRVAGFARTTDRLDQLARSFPQSLAVFKADITRAGDLDDLVRSLERANIDPDILINNAGYGEPGPILDVPAGAIRRQFEVNVFGLIELTRRIAPRMIARKAGLVVNVGSSAGRISSPFNGVYAASKHALEAISESLRSELTPFGVRVTLLEFGRLDTPFVEKTAEAGKSLQNAVPGSPFQPFFAKAVEKGACDRGQPLAAIAQKILRVLASPDPAPRYTFDSYTRMLFLLRAFLPDRIYETLMLKRNGLQRT